MAICDNRYCRDRCYGINDLTSLCNENFETIKLTPTGLIELVSMIQKGTISGKMAKEIVPKCLAGESPKALIESQGGGQISDESELMALRTWVLSAKFEA